MGKLGHNYIFDLLEIKPRLVALKEQNKQKPTATKTMLHSHVSMEVARPAAPECDNCSYVK